jgi:hypothetical protein
MSDKSPFADPPNVATISLRDIMERRRPVLYVSHDAGNGWWQFTDGRDNPNPADGVVLGLACVLDIDPSVAEVADLPLGWRAWREDVGQPWQREPGT